MIFAVFTSMTFSLIVPSHSGDLQCALSVWVVTPGARSLLVWGCHSRVTAYVTPEPVVHAPVTTVPNITPVTQLVEFCAFIGCTLSPAPLPQYDREKPSPAVAPAPVQHCIPVTDVDCSTPEALEPERQLVTVASPRRRKPG